MLNSSLPLRKSPEYCFPCNKCKINTKCNEFTKKQYELLIKERELLNKEKELERKSLELRKRSKRREKSDQKAEKKLKETSMMLLHAIRQQKIRKDCKCNLIKTAKKTKKKKRAKHNTHKFFPNVLIKLLPRPCSCKSLNKKTADTTHTYTDKCLQKLFCRPCTYGNLMTRNIVMPLSRRCGPSNNYNAAAGDCYLMSLRRTPQLWIHDLFPHFYPHYLSARARWMGIGRCFLFCAAFLFWTPCLLCLAVLKCFYCTCCTDC